MLKWGVFAAALLSAPGAFATNTFYLDSFTVWRNTTGMSIADYSVWSQQTPLFQDNFDDGLAPPSAPSYSSGTAAAYTMIGSFADGAEHAGKLEIDTSTGAAGTNASGQSRLTLGGRLNTNTSSDITRGLRLTHGFAVMGVYDLAIPDASTVYGIRLSDSVSDRNDYAELEVRSSSTGVTTFRMLHQDFLNGTSVVDGSKSFVVAAAATQVALLFVHDTVGDLTVTGYYSFLDASGSMLPWTMIGQQDLFNGEDFTQASFVASQPGPVPEPGMPAMLLLGLGVIAAVRRRTRA